ncbi:MAG TPA: NADPH-dependent F420 reductase [Longimicrobiales bacterium]|nr:NADPH-dependent F420 reductase [Longimicrobiales bacterium]
MRIGILGAGHIGGTAARLFVRAGHDVEVSNSRGPDSLRELVAELGPRARAGTIQDAAAFGDVVLLAVPWRAQEAMPRPETVAGKIVIDAMNPYTPTGGIYDLGGSTSSEEVQKRLPGARLVKAFNTMHYRTLASEGRPDRPFEERLAIFLAGDDADAKRVVAELIEKIGFAPVDTGSLREGGRSQQPGSPIYNRPLTGREAREAVARGAGSAPGSD